MKKIQNSQTIRWKNILYILGILFFTFLVTERFIGRLNKAPDLLEQFIASKSFATSHGLNYHYINIEDLSQPVQEVFTKWPPGLSILTSFGFLFTDNVRLIYISFSFINILIFLFATTYLISLLTTKISKRAIFFLIFGFYSINGSFIYSGIATDLICLNLFVFSSIFLLKYQRIGRNYWLALACLCIVLTVYFRYAYLAAIIAIPLYFSFRIFIYKSQEWLSLLLSSIYTGIISIPIAAHIIYINSQTSYIKNVSGDGTTFYWENLKIIDPFPLSSFFPIQTFMSGMGFERFQRIFLYPYYLDILFYLTSVFLIALTAIYLRKINSKSNLEISKNTFFRFGVIVSLSLMFLIYYGSLTTPSKYDDFNWSWAKIHRYFFIPIFIIHLSYLFILLDLKSQWLIRTIKGLLLLSILSGLTIRFYTYSKPQYKLYDYRANDQFLYQNNYSLNSYLSYQQLPYPGSNLGVVLIDKEINNHLFMSSTYFLFRNYVTGVIDDNFNIDLKTSAPVDIYILGNSNLKTPSVTASLINKYNAELFRTLEHDPSISIYKLLLEPEK